MLTLKIPFVKVPVLSTPLVDAAPIPAKKLRGTDITRAQGHDTTKNVKAR